MPGRVPSSSPGTNPSIFLRLNASDPRPREIAWNDFHTTYGPVIRAFARKLGAREQDVDDAVQDVMLGFFGKVPTFTYDPARGRFRGYLKVCTYRAICRRFGQRAKLKSTPLESLGEDALEVEQVWNDVWERQQLERAMADLRERHKADNSWHAFELNVVRGRPAADVAAELGVSLSAVYKARDRIGEELRQRIAEIQASNG